MKPTFLLLFPALLAAQVTAPNPGFARFAGLPIESILGVPGNLLLVPSAFAGADAVAFSDRLGLIAKAQRIHLVQKDGTVLGKATYSGSEPILNIGSTAESALAWLPSERALLYWRDGQVQRVPVLDEFAAVTSVALVGPQTAQLLTSNADTTVSALEISLESGNTRTVAILPSAHAPAYAFGSDVIYRDEAGLEIEHADGTKRTLASPARAFRAERMSDSWVHLYFPTLKLHYALHLGSAPTLSQLPTPSAEGTK